MTERTALDVARARMIAAPDEIGPALAFYRLLAASELFLLLDAEAEDDRIRPTTFATSDGTFVLAFDREERLAQFAEGPSPYAAMSGRAIVASLTGRDLGLAVNAGSGPAAALLAPGDIDWLKDALGSEPDPVAVNLHAVRPPSELPQRFLPALDARLAMAGDIADRAYLVTADDAGGGSRHLLGVVGASAEAGMAIARAVKEAQTLCEVEVGVIDVAVFDASDPIVNRLAAVGLRFDLPKPQGRSHRPAAPGSDPDKPPVLR